MDPMGMEEHGRKLGRNINHLSTGAGLFFATLHSVKPAVFFPVVLVTETSDTLTRFPQIHGITTFPELRLGLYDSKPCVIPKA